MKRKDNKDVWYMYYKKRGEPVHLCSSGEYTILLERLCNTAIVLGKKVSLTPGASISGAKRAKSVFINGWLERFFITKSRLSACTTWVQ